MELLAASHTALALVNLVFAIVALAVGFAAGAWVCGTGTTDAKNEGDNGAAEPKVDLQQQIELDRTVLASDRLRDLASGVADDVHAHNASIGEIEANLEAARSSGAASEADVVQALASIASANASLQAKLEVAEAQIQDQAEQIRTHESEARTDALTSLSNRRAFDDELKRRLSEWERNRTPLSLLIMDVDHFKKFNDTHGHQAGDEVLRKVAEKLGGQCREMDLPCRYGGEEFAIIMPATEHEGGGRLAERVRTAIEEMVVHFEGKSLKVTMSLGLAEAISADDSASIIKRADDALYESKAAGRNNAHRHDGEKCVPISAHIVSQSQPTAQPTPQQTPTVVLDALPNRTRFLEDLRQSVRVAADTDAPLALLTAELEGYGTVASEFGESVARLTLDSVAQFLENALRDSDTLGQLDESQFIVLMKDTDATDANLMASRLSKALAECSVPIGNKTLNLRTRTSVTVLGPDDSAVSLMERAEKGLQAGAPLVGSMG